MVTVREAVALAGGVTDIGLRDTSRSFATPPVLSLTNGNSGETRK
jgi:hypothetical protein